MEWRSRPDESTKSMKQLSEKTAGSEEKGNRTREQELEQIMQELEQTKEELRAADE